MIRCDLFFIPNMPYMLHVILLNMGIFLRAGQPCPTATPLTFPLPPDRPTTYSEHILKSSAFVFLLYLSHTCYTKNHRLLLLNTNHVIQCSMINVVCRQSATAMGTRVLLACWQVRGPRQSAANQGACHLYSLGMPGMPPTLHRVGRMWGMRN